MKKILILLLITGMLILFACSSDERKIVGISTESEFEWKQLIDSDRKLEDIVTKCYSDDELNDIKKFSGTINELNIQFPIECIREDLYVYRISYMGESKVVMLTFDKQGKKCAGNIYILKNTKEDFENIKIGDKLESIKAFEPDGDYPFLYYNSAEIEKVSTHCSKDGYFITIQYEPSTDYSHYVVVAISEKLI